MSDDFGQQIEDWYKQTAQAFDLSVEDKSEITGASAEVFANELEKDTPRSNVDYSKGGRSAGHANAKHIRNNHRKRAHMADSITYKPGYTADGDHTGDTDTGFSDKYFDFVAKIVNNGKKEMSPKEVQNLHFIQKAQAAVQDKAVQAMADKYAEKLGVKK